MKCEIREICGDWALDIQWPRETVTIYFNSRRNALKVKRILEVDDSIPNTATVCDMVEVVRCRDCRYRQGRVYCRRWTPPRIMENMDFCSFGERKDDGV